ncbi:helix-turn-helix transcriptional regulator [bacterium]|nr:helix-turn-helix transcriptional regulator [bacterium]
MLTKLEDQILMTVWKFRGEAYGVNVYQHLSEVLDAKVAVGVVYTALDRLTKRGMLNSYKGESTAVRGGMRKKFFELTDIGIQELTKSKAVHDRIWNDFGDLLEKET